VPYLVCHCVSEVVVGHGTSRHAALQDDHTVRGQGATWLRLEVGIAGQAVRQGSRSKGRGSH